MEACTEIGGNCFALFLGSQRSWKRSPLDPGAAARFQELRSLHEIDPAHIVPHGAYLMNCGSPKAGLSLLFICLFIYLFFCTGCRNVQLLDINFLPTFQYQTLISNRASSDSSCQPCFPNPDVFEKSQILLVDELSRCSLLGLNLYNFHPGSSLGLITTEKCLEKIARAINHAHRQIPTVVTGTGSGLHTHQ